jgi:phage terminase small subunit
MPGSPVKPADLGDVASKFWDDHVPQLVAAGVAREVDAPELALMCQWWAESQRIHAATPDTSIEDEAYYRLIQLGVMADKNFRALADKFGLNPQDRGKLRIKTTENKSGIRTRKRA